MVRRTSKMSRVLWPLGDLITGQSLKTDCGRRCRKNRQKACLLVGVVVWVGMLCTSCRSNCVLMHRYGIGQSCFREGCRRLSKMPALRPGSGQKTHASHTDWKISWVLSLRFIYLHLRQSSSDVMWRNVKTESDIWWNNLYFTLIWTSRLIGC